MAYVSGFEHDVFVSYAQAGGKVVPSPGWHDLNQDAASGVDGVTAAEYAGDVHANIQDLVGRLKTKRYRAKRVRRVYIPKENGKERPIGIPATRTPVLRRVHYVLDLWFEKVVKAQCVPVAQSARWQAPEFQLGDFYPGPRAHEGSAPPHH